MTKENPYQKYLSREDVMQSEIARVLSMEFPDLHWFHCPNEGKRTPFEQYKFKKMGGRAGVSDFVFLEESNFAKGFVMEIKCGVNACSNDQVDFLIRSANKGYLAAVVYDVAADALQLVREYMGSGVSLPSEGIVLVKNGKRCLVDFENGHATLCKKGSKKAEVQTVKKLFESKAKKRFGKVVVNREKLFQSPLK